MHTAAEAAEEHTAAAEEHTAAAGEPGVPEEAEAARTGEQQLEWAAFPFSRGSSKPRDQIQVSCIAGGFFTS